MAELSRSALDRLGNRLRDADRPADEDREMYHAYRASFADALEEQQDRYRSLLPYRMGEGARLKTLESTVAKLRRGTFRLSKLQDIAGVRYVVRHLLDQERAIEVIAANSPDVRRVDYRDQPQNGYRAVHLIVGSTSGRPVEVQLRTNAQDLWANSCEGLATAIDSAVKYGGGPAFVQEALATASGLWRAWDIRRMAVERLAETANQSRAQGFKSRSPEGVEAIHIQSEIDDLLEEMNTLAREANGAIGDTWAEWRRLDPETRA